MKAQPARLAIRNYFPFFRIIVYCLKIIGLAPFSVGTPASIINSRQARVEIFRFSKFGLAYNLLILIPSPVLVMLFLELWNSQSFRQISYVIRIVIIVRTSCRTFSAILIISYWTFGQRNAVRILNEILELGIEISGLRKQPSDKRSLIFLTINVIINFLVWIAFLATNVGIRSTCYNLSNFILSKGSILIVYWFIMEYSFVVGRIARDLETLNKNLQNFEGFRNSQVSYSPFVNEFLQASGSRAQSDRLAALRSLIGIQAKLSGIAQDVEDFFSIPITFCCAVSFLDIVFLSKDFIGIIWSAGRAPALVVLLNSIAEISIVVHPLISLSSRVTRTAEQAKLTAQIVRKLLVKPLGPEIKAELEKFSLQLIHEDFRFTAHEFFSLDYTMLHSMVAATTTYLVILFQFDQAD